jgi:SLOG family YspA-like protein
MLYVGIVGSRSYPDLTQVERFVWSLARKYPDCVVVSGGAPGVDHMAEEAAKTALLRVRSYRPRRRANHFEVVMYETGRFAVTIRGEDEQALRFKSYGQACFFRNGLIVADSKHLVAFSHRESRGTADSIRRARALGIDVHVFTPVFS